MIQEILLDALDYNFIKQYCDFHNIAEGKGKRLELEMFLNDYKHNVLKERLSEKKKSKLSSAIGDYFEALIYEAKEKNAEEQRKYIKSYRIKPLEKTK